ncbi:MAG: UvrD-helicase domain-containing protein [Verrucomicrobiota bacterium]
MSLAVSPAALPDAAAREAFCRETERTFSVVAPAGVGKTHAISERILALARRDDARTLLPRLIVVTYTRRAAQEMQARARARVLAARLGEEVEAAFGQAFFGTIHSLCLRLLQRHGHALALPALNQIVADEARTWAAFWQSAAADEVLRGDPAYRDLLRVSSLPEIQHLATQVRPWRSLGRPGPIEPMPMLEVEEVLAYVPEKRSAGTVRAAQTSLRHFQEALASGNRHARWPVNRSKTKAFAELWSQTLEPVRDWQRAVLTQLAGDLAWSARQFRLERGELTYDDQVALAAESLRLPAVAEQVREEEYLVILDEAQDTDPLQFEVLRRLAGMGEGENPAERRLVMVGDPQQSIYPDRADLLAYQGEHAAFADGGGQAAFQVTFRCDARIVDWVNAVMPGLLDGRPGQAAYVPLLPRPESAEGQVVRLPVEPEEEPGSGVDERARFVARRVATFLRETGLEGLRASNWSEVALLCPRRKQLSILEEALRESGIACEVHSSRTIMGDHPVYAWWCGLLWCLAHPRDGFEIVGVLREVFGCSDHDLAMHAKGHGEGWRVDAPPAAGGLATVESALSVFHQLWRRSATESLGALPAAMEEIVALRSRLNAIATEGAGDLEDIEAEWQRLRQEAIRCEREGISLADWARALREGFGQEREFAATATDAVQLLTCQKAKGLEWDAVILPLFFHPLHPNRGTYPRAVQPPGVTEPEIHFDAADVPEDFVPRGDAPEHDERMLYVAMTRARHTLVMTDDRLVFDPEGKWKARCLGRALLGFAANEQAWEKLPSTPEPELRLIGEKDAAKQVGVRPAKSGDLPLALARDHAAQFARRVTPHALARLPDPGDPETRLESAPDDDRPELPAQTPATLYGTWWHELMEAMPWQRPEAERDACYHAHLTSSPDPVRSDKEWSLLTASEIWRQLHRPELQVRAEVPFLWNQSEDRVVEGVVDLVIWDEAAQSWLILDWKTNRLPGGEREGLAALREEYAPQLEAYLEAWRSLFPAAASVRGMLYSTQFGQGVMLGGGGLGATR